jgi:hypothetical protein
MYFYSNNRLAASDPLPVVDLNSREKMSLAHHSPDDDT